jgi:hypothetical protein
VKTPLGSVPYFQAEQPILSTICFTQHWWEVQTKILPGFKELRFLTATATFKQETLLCFVALTIQ